MREDPTKSASFLNSKVWEQQKYSEDFLVAPDNCHFGADDPRNQRKFVSNSLSGNERNRMFMQTQENFADVTLLSGADDTSDARSFSLLDFDNDGWLDVALMSLNSPRFKLYRNEMGSFFPGNKALEIRLVGGHDSSKSTQSWTNRDGIGTRILATYQSGKTALFQKQAGEGFASQNSETIRIGCDADDSIANIEIRWPSGKTQSVSEPDFSNVLTIREISQ